MTRPSGPILLALALCAVAGPALLFGTPYFGNPDANFYYTAALRVAEGRFRESIDPLYSPLLSWLMAPFVRAGIWAVDAFRIVNVAGLCGCLVLAAVFGERIGLSRAQNAALVLLSALHLAFLSVRLVTPDLLGAVPCLVATLILMRGSAFERSATATIQLGACIAAAYYLKNFQGFILGLAVVLHALSEAWGRDPSARRAVLARTGAALGAAAALILPWIVATSVKAGTLVVAGQQLVFLGKVRLSDYSPDLDLHALQLLAQAGRTSPIAVDHHGGDPLWALAYLFGSLDGLLVGTCGWLALAVGTVMCAPRFLRPSPERRRWSPALCLIVCQFTLYLAVWGPYFRYYVPALIPLYGAVIAGFSSAIRSCSRILEGRRARVFALIVGALPLLESAVLAARSAYAEMAAADNDAVWTAARVPVVAEARGILVGNGGDPRAGLLAAYLRRDYLNSIFPAQNPSAEITSARLRAWRVAQVIWFGAVPEFLERAPGVRRSLATVIDGEEFVVFSVAESVSGDSSTPTG